jgi:mannose-6-phosphate isomerase-like protein (cupin superfamily)
MSTRVLAMRADDVEAWATDDGAYLSQHVIGRDSCGSGDMLLNRGTLKAGRSLDGGSHPENDEVYYIVSGRAVLDLGGDPATGDGAVPYRVEPGMVFFIPAGTYHRLRDAGDEDVVILTIWPTPPTPGANKLHEVRSTTWGTGFRLRDGRTLEDDGTTRYVRDESWSPAIAPDAAGS